MKKNVLGIVTGMELSLAFSLSCTLREPLTGGGAWNILEHTKEYGNVRLMLYKLGVAV